MKSKFATKLVFIDKGAARRFHGFKLHLSGNAVVPGLTDGPASHLLSDGILSVIPFRIVNLTTEMSDKRRVQA